MRFALKTLILAMMAMLIASVSMAQDFKPTLNIFGMVRVDLRLKSVKDDTSSGSDEDGSSLRLSRLQLGFDVRPAQNVRFKGEFRATAYDEDTTSDSTGNSFSNPYKLGLGDCWGEWQFVGPMYIKAGTWWYKVGLGMYQSIYHDPWYTTMIDNKRVGQVELGAKIGSLVKVGVGAYSPANDNEADKTTDNINDFYGFVHVTPKIGPLNLAVGLGIASNCSDGYTDGGYSAASYDDKLWGLQAEVNISVIGIHFNAGMWTRLNNPGATGAGVDDNLKMAFGIEAGYSLSFAYFGAKMDMAVYEDDSVINDGTGQYSMAKTAIGLTATVTPAKNTTIGTEVIYAVSGRKQLDWLLQFKWSFNKIFDL